MFIVTTYNKTVQIHYEIDLGPPHNIDKKRIKKKNLTDLFDWPTNFSGPQKDINRKITLCRSHHIQLASYYLGIILLYSLTRLLWFVQPYLRMVPIDY